MIAYIVKQMTDKRKNVLFLVHRQELKEQIKNTLQRFNVNLNFVYLGMVQSVVNRLEKMGQPHIIITDESHHSLANSYKKIYDYFSDVHRLHFTATPVRLNGDGLGEVNDCLILGQTVEWLIDHQFLAPFKYYAPKIINDELLKIQRGEFTTRSIDEIYKDRTIYGDVLKHYTQLANNTQAIIYCHSIKQSQKVAQLFNSNGYKAVHIDAKTKDTTRTQYIEQFRQQTIKILCNVDLIGEGFDVPDCETVILLRPTQSLSLHIQQSMRSMRYKPNKIAIIIDHVGNVNRHGLPTTQHEWTLETKDKKAKTKKQNTIKLKTCEHCFQVYGSRLKKCPHCGKFPNTQNTDLMIEQNAVLEEVNTFTLCHKQPKDCKTLKELQELAKIKGYKSGWAYHQAKLKKII